MAALPKNAGAVFPGLDCERPLPPLHALVSFSRFVLVGGGLPLGCSPSPALLNGSFSRHSWRRTDIHNIMPGLHSCI